MKDKFTAKVKSENRKAADVLREYIEYYTLGYVPKKGIDKQTNSAKRFRLDENDALSFDEPVPICLSIHPLYFVLLFPIG